MGYNGHPTKLLRYLPLNGRFTPNMPFPKCLANDKVAAYPDVPTLQYFSDCQQNYVDLLIAGEDRLTRNAHIQVLDINSRILP